MALPRVVVLGGGVGGVTAALELSRDGWQSRYGSITLVQQGWRLGGKGASGRGEHRRIEEHGLHIWFGFYENAFRLLADCHAALDALAAAGIPRWPLAATTMEDSFLACGEIALTDHDGCCWSSWIAEFARFDDDRPWIQPDPRPAADRPDGWSVAHYGARCLRLAADLVASLVRSGETAEILSGPLDGVTGGLDALLDAASAAWSLLDDGAQAGLDAAAEALEEAAAAPAESGALRDAASFVLAAVDLASEVLRGLGDGVLRASDTARRAWYVTDVMLAIVRGLIDDGVLEADRFDVVDDIDFIDWLRAHGAEPQSAGCALVRGIVYDLAFAYRDGDPQRPSCGAGTALRGLLRTFFTYRGALMWKMRSGMGDIVFAPMYELLVKRGVEVEFFHRVEAVRAANGLVTDIEIDVQATVPTGTAPEDYLHGPAAASGAPARALWPSAPTVPLAPTAKAVAPEVYESYLAPRAAARVATRTLTHGAATDGFEVVVYALPIATVPLLAPDLVAQSARWAAAAVHVRSVPTQAMQLWLDRPASQLGDLPDGVVVGGFVEPYDTWADMTHLVAEEDVPAATVAYFCNALLDAPMPVRGQADAWLAERRAVVREHAVRFLTRDIGTLWPHAVDPLTGALDWDRLLAPPGVSGEARLDAQYLRANVEPSERYVLSLPGSSAHRIHPGDTGFANLVVAGDWTACVIDAGCVEAATISGMRAANAVHAAFGDPSDVRPIIGDPAP